MELIVVGFPEKYKADEVMLDILKSESESLSELEDVVVITKNAEGKIRVKPYFDLIAETRGRKSEFWGKFIQTLFEEDEKTSLENIGIDQQFCQKLDANMPINSSAIFILVHNKLDPEKVITKINEYNGVLLRASLIQENENQLYSSLVNQ
jgi:uncharacterized membrane protein